MPKAKKPSKPVAPVAPAPPPPPEPPALAPEHDLPVVYDQLEIDEYSTTSPKGPIDVEWCKMAMGWETEKEWQQRMVEEEKAKGNANAKPEHFLFGDGVTLKSGRVQPVHCKNLAGEKVICWNNANNRPFDESWCEHLIHTILYGQWAGPFTIPGETVNGETVRISRYGRVLSGQHQMTACILAGEWIAKARLDGTDSPAAPKYPVWMKHGNPFIETVVIKGTSEDPRVLMTVDYVKPRTAADVFYTSEVFKQSTPPERKELCRMLATAVDLLWTRTEARGYKTHPELVGFLERHKRLLSCVLHLFAENSTASGRKISKLRISAGNCSALCYLQGSSGPKTDGDVYRNEEPPTEKNLDWSMWDKAEEFWTLLASGKDFTCVRVALGRLVDSTPGNEDNQGLGGRWLEKLAIIARAWERWKEHPASAGPPFGDEDLEDGGQLCLSYSDLDDSGNTLPDGEIKLLDLADFLGIDCPQVVSSKNKTVRDTKPEPPAPTREEIEQATQEALKRRQQQSAKK